MGEVGSFGDIIFEVSVDSDFKKKILSFNGLTRDTESKYQNHELIGQKPRTEFVAPGLYTVSFTVLLNGQFGIKPRDEMNRWLEYCRSGDAAPLIIGGSAIGVDKWVVTSVSQQWEKLGGNGELLFGRAEVTLQEYLESMWTTKAYRDGWLARQKALEEVIADKNKSGYNGNDTRAANGINLDEETDDWESPSLSGAVAFYDPAAKYKNLLDLGKTIVDYIGITPDEDSIELWNAMRTHLSEIRDDKGRKRDDLYNILYGTAVMWGKSDIRDSPVSGIDIVHYVQNNGITVTGKKDYLKILNRSDMVYSIYPQEEYNLYASVSTDPITKAEFFNICGPYWELDCSDRTFSFAISAFSIAVSFVLAGVNTYCALKNVDLAKINVNLPNFNSIGLKLQGYGTVYALCSDTVTVTYNAAVDVASLSAFQLAVLMDSIATNGVSGAPGGGSGYTGKPYEGVRNPHVDFTNAKGNSTLTRHFEEHKKDFNFHNEEEYLNGARNFLEKSPTSTMQSFISNEGTYFRYDLSTNEFGIINKYGGISTYFKPDEGVKYWVEKVINVYAPK